MADEALIEALRDPRCYPHPVEHVHVVETHISWIVLTGDYAYKLKKPLNLGFLDFSTLEARRSCCEEELRLNRRLAPDLYLEVVTVNGSPECPAIGGPGPVLEYAVKIRQFREDGLLDRVQERGALLPAHVDALARLIAEFHHACESAPAGSAFGSPESVVLPARQNFEQISALLSDPADQARLAALAQWTERSGRALEARFRARQRDGFVRECHGDLHLGNAFIEGTAIRIFDCIEFNANLRWIDVMSDVAFMVMDLWHRNHPDLARRFLNGYLEQTGDYEGVAVLSYYLVYRALVRAKVARIRSAQPDVPDAERAMDRSDYQRLVGLAESFSAPRPLWVVLTHGVTGSGKSHFSQRLVEGIDSIRIRSDLERKRLAGLPRQAATGSPVGGGLYSDAANRSTYQHVASLTGAMLDAGWSVIADAAFLERWQRDLVAEPARLRHIPVIVLDFRASEATLRRRVTSRAGAGTDPSEATLAVLEHQLRCRQPLGRDERLEVSTVDGEAVPDPGAIIAILERWGRANVSPP